MKWTQDALIDAGFAGFVRFSELPTAQVPTDPGVYVVIRTAEADPEFLQTSLAGWFKGKDPSVPVSMLEAAWVPGSSVVYLGKANGGATGRRGLRKRLDEYRRHGAGEPVGHWADATSGSSPTTRSWSSGGSPPRTRTLAPSSAR